MGPIQKKATRLAGSLNIGPGISAVGLTGNQETQFKEWGVVEGVRYPRVTVLLIDSRKSATITVDRIKLNGGLDKKELSAKPRDLKPNLGLDGH